VRHLADARVAIEEMVCLPLQEIWLHSIILRLLHSWGVIKHVIKPFGDERIWTSVAMVFMFLRNVFLHKLLHDRVRNAFTQLRPGNVAYALVIKATHLLQYALLLWAMRADHFLLLLPHVPDDFTPLSPTKEV